MHEGGQSRFTERVSTATVPIEVTDYERIFAVLDACEDAVDLTGFRHSVVGAVSEVFGVRGVTFFAGPSVRETFDDTAPVISGDGRGVASAHLEDYLRNWSKDDVFATPEAIRQLHTTGSVSLDDLSSLPESATTYVEKFLHRVGFRSCNALTFSMGDNGVGLLGLFDPDPDAVNRRDMSALRLLCRRLRGVSRALASTPQIDVLGVLTKRQRDVVVLLAEGLTNAQIASKLVVTEDTVKKYVSRALAATDCRSRTELALRASAY